MLWYVLLLLNDRMALGSSTTTNDSAEYYGLVQDLGQAKNSGFNPLRVIGDCLLVLTYLRLYRSPRKSQVAALYHKACAIADDVTVASWAHWYREYNRMADRSIHLNGHQSFASSSRTDRQSHRSYN